MEKCNSIQAGEGWAGGSFEMNELLLRSRYSRFIFLMELVEMRKGKNLLPQLQAACRECTALDLLLSNKKRDFLSDDFTSADEHGSEKKIRNFGAQ